MINDYSSDITLKFKRKKNSPKIHWNFEPWHGHLRSIYTTDCELWIMKKGKWLYSYFLLIFCYRRRERRQFQRFLQIARLQQNLWQQQQAEEEQEEQSQHQHRRVWH